MAGRGRGKALTRPAWMDIAPPATPQLASAQSSAQSVSDWARATAADGRPYWYSLSTGKTSWTDPIVTGWRELKTPEGRAYYFNEITKVTQWEKPASLQLTASTESLPAGWTAHKTPDGRDYYHHKVSGETRWERPTNSAANELSRPIKRPAAAEEGEWKAHTTTDGRTYYYNAVTRETSWTKPSDTFEPKRVKIDTAAGDLRQKLVRRREEKVTRNETFVRRPRNSEGKTLTDRQAEAYFLKRAKLRRGEGAEVVLSNGTDAEALFMQLLREKGIGENDTWLEAMGRCSNDPRYNVLKSYGSRKHAWLKVKQKAAKEGRRQRVIIHRANDESFLKLMEEIFVNEPFTATTLERCNADSVRRFESDPRYRVVEERKRAGLIRAFLGVRSRREERELSNRHRECIARMRAELNKMIDPSLISLNTTEKGEKADHKGNLFVDGNTNGLNASPSNLPNNGKIYFSDRTPFRELERFLVNVPGSDIISDNDRADIIREWRKHLDKLMHEKRSREREARKVLQRERRASFRSGVERMLLEGQIPFSAHWKDVSDIVMKESFALSEEELDARLSDLFHHGVELFQDRVQRHREEFKRLLKEAKVEVKDDTSMEDLQKVDILTEFIKGQKHPVVAALLAERKRRESRRRQKEMQRATEEFRELLHHDIVSANSTYESVIEVLQDRGAFKQLLALAGDDGVRKIFDDFMEKRSEPRGVEPNRLKRKHDNPAAPIPFDHEALAALERAKRIRLPSSIPPVSYRPPPPPVRVRVEEESGWAAAVSAKPMTEKEKHEAKEKRKRELLGTLGSHGQMLINEQTSLKEPK